MSDILVFVSNRLMSHRTEQPCQGVYPTPSLQSYRDNSSNPHLGIYASVGCKRHKLAYGKTELTREVEKVWNGKRPEPWGYQALHRWPHLPFSCYIQIFPAPVSPK